MPKIRTDETTAAKRSGWTASIAAMFVGTQERQVEREILRDMHNQLRAVRQEIAELRAALEEARRANPPAPPTE